MHLRFADCTLDPDRHELRRGDAVVHVEPQVFDLLLTLVQAEGALVTRDALVETVWRGLNVSDATISARIAAARAAVGDDGKAQRVIQTVPRRGVRLAVDVELSGAAPPLMPEALRPETRMTRSADGTPIAWARSGSGPPLLRAGHWLSHLDLDWESPVWAPLLAALGRGRTLVRYDQRGTGLSGRTLVSTDLQAFVGDMAAVADAAGLDRFPIYAPSQAAPVALRYAAENPDRVSRLILVGGYAVGRALRPADPEDTDEATVLSLIRKGWGRRGSTFVRAFSALFMPDATPEQVDDFVRIQLASATPETAIALRQAVDRFDVRDVLDRVQAPVLLLHASGDVIQPVDEARAIAAGLADARLVLLESDNHVVLPQHPEWPRSLSEIESFLAQAD